MISRRLPLIAALAALILAPLAAAPPARAERVQIDPAYNTVSCSNCSGAAGTSSNASDAQATSSTNGAVLGWNYGFNGTTWDRLQVDGSKFLKVNCAVGCAGGSASNASSGVATSSSNGVGNSWLYGFNGTTWDQLQVDGSKFLKVDIAAGTVATTVADGAAVTIGAKADAKSTATDTTAITIMQVLKEISAMAQTPPTRAVTNAGTFAVQSTPAAAATGGATVSSKLVANNTTSVAIDASAGTLYGVSVFNNSGTIAYLKLYNAAQGSTTCGSGTPVQRIMIPANTAGAGAVIPFPLGVAYSTAITSCVTTGIADADATSPAASAYLIEFYYK